MKIEARVWLKRLGWTVGLVALLMLATWLALPWVIQSQGQKQLSALLGRPVTLGHVDVKPWSLELTLNDIAIAGADAKAPPLLAVQRLYANLQLASAWHRGVVIKALQIDQPVVNLARTTEGHYDIDDLIARFTPKTPAEPAGEPARFALANVELRNGSLRFDDRPAGRVHELKALNLALPFLSDLPADVEVTVRPRLSFALNGAAFDSGAEATPFAADRASTMKLRIGQSAQDELDLAPYLGYLPETLPVRVQKGRVGAEIELQFAARPDGTPRLSLRGDVHVSDLAVADARRAPLLGWKRLAVELKDVQPLAHRVSLGAITLAGATAELSRDAQGRLNVASAEAPASAPRPGARAASAPAPAASSAWQVTADSFAVDGASVRWRDAGTQPAAALSIEDLSVQVKSLQWPTKAAMPVSLKARIGVPDTPADRWATLGIEGQASDTAAALRWQLSSLPLEAFAPYLAGTLSASAGGRLEGSGSMDWAAGASPKLAVSVADAQLLDFRLTPASTEADAPRRTRGRQRVGGEGDLALQALRLHGAEVDLQARHARIASIVLQAPSIRVDRDADGQWNALKWMKSPTAAPAPASRAAKPEAPQPNPWRVQLADFRLDAGRVRFSDARPRPGAPAPRPVRLDLSAVRLTAQGLDWNPAAPAANPPVQVGLSATIGRIAEAQATNGPASTFDWKGSLALQPLAAKGTLRLSRIPVHVFAAYGDNPLRIELRRAYLGWRGDISFRQEAAGPAIDASGSVRVGDLRVASLDPVPAASAASANDALRPGSDAADELLRWQRLQLDGVKFGMKPGSAPRLDIASAELADLYARLVVTEQGRLNLQDVKAAPEPADSAASAAAPKRAAPGASSVSASPVVAAASAPASAAMSINVAGTKLVNARIDFADHFVKPNYSAALTELNGSLGAFHSGSTEMAALELKGRAEGSALLEITGKLNPTADPLALDIHAKATDLELAPLSPYAGKYAGYAIQRGKLSMDVAYKIDPDGRLEASNRVILNQLTFGDRIESPQATRLPVRLAIALLKDRNGVINLNLPVSGSLNDPQFSVAGLIGRVLLNLLVKAVTSPFALLGGGGGGGEAGLSQIEFRPGTALLAEGQQAALDKVAQALGERPALNMTVTGESDPARETEAYRAALLEQQLVNERRRELIRAGGAASPAPAASAPITLSTTDRERLIKQVYDRSDVPGKPKNFIGLAKGVPTADMERLLTAAQPATPEAMRELALQRGLAVRDALIAKGLKSDRLFLAAPKVGAAAVQAEKQAKATDATKAAAVSGAASGVTAEAATPWVPRAELSLATN